MHSDSDSEENHLHALQDNDGDLANYNTTSITGLHNHAHNNGEEGNGGIIGIIKTVLIMLFRYLQSSLKQFPIISYWFTWFFIISGLGSIITRWFLKYFYVNVFREFRWLQLFSFLIPISLPFNCITAATIAFHGARIEEMRGSSYLLCFIILITILTNSTMFIMQIFLNIGPFPIPDPLDPDHTLPLTWLQRHISTFDSYGWDYLPFAIVMLHGFMSKHPYISIFSLPLRLHMTPSLFLIGLLFGLTHNIRLIFTIPIALCWCWTLKHILLSNTYTKLTGLLLTPLLCTLGPLEQHYPWSYNKTLTDEQQMHETEEIWHNTEKLSKYVISLRTSERLGELQCTETLLQRSQISTQFSQLTFLPPSTDQITPISTYSSTTISTSSPPPSINFNLLANGNNNRQYDEMNINNDAIDDTTNLATPQRSLSNSSDETAGLTSGYQYDSSSTTPTNINSTNNRRQQYTNTSSNGYGEHSALLVDPPDQTCFDCGANDRGKKLLKHLKFKSFVFKHTRDEMYPKHVQYIAIKEQSVGITDV